MKPGGGEEVSALLEHELFEQLPFNAAVIDREWNIVRANSHFEEYFGDWRGRRCYEVYKGQGHPCERCEALATFSDGRVRVSDETGVDRFGRTCHYVVHLAPLRDPSGKVRYLLEFSTDVTETRRWRREYDILFERVPCYLALIDRDYRILRANEKFRATFGEARGRLCYQVYKRQDSPCENCPAAQTFSDGREHVSTQTGVSVEGKTTHYVVRTTPLSRGNEGVAAVIEMATDITELRRLEAEKLDSERLAAVGQTVAGLAHTIKNMLMGLEGGLYMVDSGLKRGDAARLAEGWEILQRNFNKTTSLVKDFLSFAKGRRPSLKPVDPGEVVRSIVDLYHETALGQGVQLLADVQGEVAAAPLDPEGIEACLTNLVSNGIDAAVMGENEDKRVVVRVRDEGGDLIFEVEDNGCGMDMEVRKQVFTTFFTTKGGKGTGLGLLTTRKIVQEHGGVIHLETKEGEGSLFRIRFPRSRLAALAEEAAEGDSEKDEA